MTDAPEVTYVSFAFVHDELVLAPDGKIATEAELHRRVARLIDEELGFKLGE